MVTVNIRNIALIAHVDHGKTNLVDAMLRQRGTFLDNQEVKASVLAITDLALESEITIISKNSQVHCQGLTINILDTQRHDDFGEKAELLARWR